MQAILIPADGSEPRLTVVSSLEQMQLLVGGYVTVMPLPIKELEMIVCEDAVALKMPVNVIASVRAGRRVLGDVLLVGPVDEDGEWTNIPLRTAAAFTEE